MAPTALHDVPNDAIALYHASTRTTQITIAGAMR
jgi:hypothetical protein